MSVKTERICNIAYKESYIWAKEVIQRDGCMTVYDTKKPIYLEINALEVGLDTGLFQVRDGMKLTKNKAPNSIIL